MKNDFDKRMDIFKRDKWVCQHCGRPVVTYGTPQIAHRISQDKVHLKKYGKSIIHHPLNMAATCSLACNAKFDLGGKTMLIKQLVNEIKQAIEKGVE